MTARGLFRVFAAGLLGVHAFRAALLMLQAGDARPRALLIVAHRDVQRAAALAGELDLVAVHERIEPAMVGAGGQDVAALACGSTSPTRCSAESCAPCRRC